MVTTGQIYQFIDQIAPFSLQMSFDNAGFLVGSQSATVTKVLVSLDITQAVVEECIAIGAQLIVSHHPVIFHPVKSITDADPLGQMLQTMIRHNISAICAHTNLDLIQEGVNDALAQALGLEEVEAFLPGGVNEAGQSYGLGRIGTVAECALSEFAPRVKSALQSNGLRIADGGKPVRRVAVGGGACAGHFKDAVNMGCDTFVTADAKYNDFLDAKDLGLTLIDAGHYPTEQVVCPSLVEKLNTAFPDVDIYLTKMHKEVCTYL